MARNRLLITEAGAAGLFIVAAGLLAAFASSARGLSVSALVVTVVAYLIAGRVQYPVGSSWTAPTQSRSPSRSRGHRSQA